MLTLGFESSAKAASVAVMEDGRLLGQSWQKSGLTHSRTLLPMAEDLLKNLDLRFADLDRIAVSQGPGSFTGVRIGVATVKGLCWALEKQAVGVSTLEAMAWNGLSFGEGALICGAMDARRSQVYNALFEIRGGRPERRCPDRAIALEELTNELKKTDRHIFVVGDGTLLCYNALENAGLSASLAPEPLRDQSAWGVCMAAEGREASPAGELLPVYLRLSQAERERQARLERS